MNTDRPLGLFEGFGVELEYMIVGTDLSIRPLADQLLYAVSGRYESEVEIDELAWSNELALHVIELKTNGPAGELNHLPALFLEHVQRINRLLRPFEARLLPTAMHPWMNPLLEMKLWPHEYNAIYEAFNRIFDCRGHGWANLQSVHLNLPFRDEEEFGRLHAAIRLILPILPALAASSPLMDQRLTGLCDNRLSVYRTNARSIPSISGLVIPEAVFTRRDYDQQIFQPMYRDIAPHDPDGVLQHEWLNARGAIARFDRQTIEIRVLDVQECPLADLAICHTIVDVLRAAVAELWISYDQQKRVTTEQLAKILNQTIADADETLIDDPQYLQAWGIAGRKGITALEIWRHVASQTAATSSISSALAESQRMILDNGPLARRLLRHLQPDSSLESIRATYEVLCECLDRGEMFRAANDLNHPVS